MIRPLLFVERGSLNGEPQAFFDLVVYRAGAEPPMWLGGKFLVAREGSIVSKPADLTVLYVRPGKPWPYYVERP